jgi:hypothetical protein
VSDWALLEGVRQWGEDPDPRKRALAEEWARILAREVKWKMAYDHTETMDDPRGKKFLEREDLKRAIRKALPAELRDVGTGGIAGGMRWLMALFFALSGGVLWLVVPRYAWARQPIAGIVPAEGPAPRAKPAAAPAADTTGLRRDVEEAPPRKPGDITRERPALSAASTPSRPARGS